MSRTHSHKNYVGRFLDEKSPRQIHDHREGECDLPTRKKWESLLKEARHPHLLFKEFRCVWDFSIEYYVRQKFCDCAYCTGSYDRELDKRRDRRSGKRVSQNYDTLLDDDDF
jgi:hypothetical protein